MTALLCRHKVADFATWKRVFDSHTKAHKEAGMTLKHLWRNLEEPGEVFLLFNIEDVAKAKAFLNAPRSPEARQQSGVTDTPDTYFLK